MAAINTANNLLYLMEAGLLSFFVISSIFGHRNLSRLQITLKAPEEIFAATEYPLHITVANRGKFMPAFLFRIGSGETSLLFPYLAPGRSRSASLPFSFPKRGAAFLAGLTVSSLFPFHFTRREREISHQIPLIVFPQPLEQGAKALDFTARHPAGEELALRPGQGREVLAVRDYRAGDALRHIHWKASARTGELKTKEMAAAVAQPLIIDFHEIAGADLERKLSAVVFLILSLLKRNVKVGLRIDGKYYPPGQAKRHRLAMLTELALYDPEKSRNKG